MNIYDFNKQYFKTPLQEVIFYDKYSRFNHQLNRRETWLETVSRVVLFLRELSNNRLDEQDYIDIYNSILDMEVMPSMRLLAMAGEAARRNSLTIYNCSFIGIDNIKAFGETLQISFSGCGVGFSVEDKYISKLPYLPLELKETENIFTVQDTTEGWQDAIDYLISELYRGHIPTFNYDLIRPSGTPLKVKGGNASGPIPLIETVEFIKDIFKSHYHNYSNNPKENGKINRYTNIEDSKLSSIDVHDIMCTIGNCAVSGGTRRCLSKGTGVHTDKGVIPIEQIKVNDLVMTSQGYRKVTESLYQGKQDIVRVELETGYSFNCTEDHRVAVLTDVYGNYKFKKIRDIHSKDRLLFITEPININSDTISLKKLRDFREADKIRTPIKQPILDEQTAWILGKFLTDGHVLIKEYTNKGKDGNRRVGFSCHIDETEQIDRITNWFEDIGVIPTITKEKGNWCNIISNNRRLTDWFSNYKKANTSINIPEEIFQSSKNIREAFILGIVDGDGTKKDRPFVAVSTVYKDFGLQLIKLLATLGILSEIKLRRKKKGNWKELYVVTVKDSLSLQKIYDFILDVPVRKGKQKGYNVPIEFVKKVSPSKIWNKRIPTLRDANHHTVKEIFGFYNNIPVKVKDISLLGEESTYDISVEEQVSFVIEGGILVHNTAMISLFDKEDEKMLNAKSDNYNEYRWNANNSIVFNDKLTQKDILKWASLLVENKNGEPGLYSRYNAKLNSPERRNSNKIEGINPCGEIDLRQNQLCNLSAVIARKDDTFDELMKKVRLATIIGTIQASSTNFIGLNYNWKNNCEEEALLGVDITGQMDCDLLNGIYSIDSESHIDYRYTFLHDLKEHAVYINKLYSEKLGTNQAVAVTCNKPSGNTSQLVNCSSGIHPRFSEYYIRNIRININTPIFKVLYESGLDYVPENGQNYNNMTTAVFSFPVKSPDNAITRSDMSAIDMCEHWKLNKLYYTEHNPSITIMYREDEILDIVNWLWKNKDIIGGMSFLPYSDAKYDNMPYVEITKEEYESKISNFPEIKWELLQKYETKDETIASQELACFAGNCML